MKIKTSKNFLIWRLFAVMILVGSGFVFINVNAEEVPDLPAELAMPGTIEGTGAHFEITNSEYFNITLDSSEFIKLRMESIPEMIMMIIEPISSAASTRITISGLNPSTTYYKYQDDYHNLEQFITDENGRYGYIQDLLIRPHLVFIQPRGSTKFIKDDASGGDCYLIGSWDSNTKTCTLTEDVYETIQIDSNNITLDGGGRTITGSNTANGVYTSSKSGVSIKNITVEKFTNGISLGSSDGNTVSDNTLSSNFYSLLLNYSDNNKLDRNKASDNINGINLFRSDFNYLVSNTVFRNSNIGIAVSSGINNVLDDNAISNNKYGIYLNSSYNFQSIAALTGNIISNNDYGVYLRQARNNNLSNNVLSNNNSGIYVDYGSSGNTITKNNIITNSYGIHIQYEGNEIYNNNFIDNPTQVNVGWGWYNRNFFSRALPTGGSYWSNFDTPAGGCNDLNNDNLCDSPYIFTGGQDNLPWTEQNGWLTPPNQLPTFSGLQQYKPDGTTSIEEGASITEDEIVFRGTLNDPDGDLIKLQVELREASQPFTGSFDGGILESSFIASGELAVITSSGLAIGDYHWRARAVDARGGVSDWQEFGQPGNVDFAIRALPQLSMEAPSMFKSDGLTRLNEGALTTENVVVLSATTTSRTGNQVKLEAQVRAIGSPSFQDTDPILSGSFVDSGSRASVTIEVPAEIQYDPADHPYQVRVRAADSQGNRSDWLELGQPGNTDFTVKLVPLYTQVTSDFPSATLTAQWAAEPYGTGNYTDCLRRDRDTGQPVPNSSTIGRCGCAITSVVMMLRYYNIMKNADSEDVDPITLNTWLTNPPAGIAGYDPHGNLTNAWASIPFYAADQSGRRRIVFEGKHNISDGLFSSEALLRDQIDVRLTTSLPQPVILYEAGSATAPDHFIVATGKLATTYNIRDPRWYKTKYLSQAISGPDERNYANSFTGLRLYRPVAALDPVPSFLAASVASPVELLITDPIGRRVGWDPVSGQIFSEIAAASYTEEGISDPTTDAPQAAQHRSKSIWIPEPLGGQYALKVVGTDTGGYTLNAFVGDSHGKPEEKILAGNTASDVVAAYNINFNAQDAQALTIAPQDTTPPITTLTALGMQGKNDWMITPAEITLAAEDNPGGVGVFKTEYSLDNGETWILYGGPFVIEDDGANLVAYRSEDFVGNKEEAKFSFVRIDTTPPEARASFDPVSLSIKVEGIDNLSQPTISQNGSTYTLEDLAGNTTAIVLEETKQAGKQFKAGLKSIQYGNQPPIVLNADLKAEWSLEKDGTLKELTQQLQARHFKVEAKYQGKKDETSIKADTEQGGGHETRETLPHLRVAKLVTENGALTYGILIAPFSVEFNGVDSFLSRSSSPSLTLTSDFTLEAWVKILEEPAPNQSYVLVSKWEPTQNKRSYLWLYQKTASGDKQLTLCTSQAGSSFVCVAVNTRFAPLADLGVNEWHHVAARLIATSPGQPALFVDGQNIGGGITLPVPAVNDSPFTIGAGRAASGAPFFPCNCRMDEVRVWNVARTDDQIASGRFHELTSQEPNLAGYWSFAKNFLDVSPNRNDLVSQNVVFSLDSPPLAGAPVSTFASVERSLLATLPANISSATSWLMQVVRGFLR